jgi:hypothetical protein
MAGRLGGLAGRCQGPQSGDFFFASSPTSTRVCDDCAAVVCFSKADKTLSYGDFSATAKWRQHPVTHDAYLAQTSAVDLSPWALIAGWHKSRVLWDLMHNLHLGVLRDVVGNVLWTLWCFFDGATQKESADAQLLAASLDMHAWCRLNNVTTPPRNFSHGLIGSPSGVVYPELSTEVKAAHMPTILSWLVHCSEDRRSVGCLGDVRVCLTFSVARFLELLGRAEAVLTSAQAREAVSLGQRFLDCYQLLAAHALGRLRDTQSLHPCEPSPHRGKLVESSVVACDCPPVAKVGPLEGPPETPLPVPPAG